MPVRTTQGLGFLALLVFLLFIRLPFLSSPIQEDDVYYLAGAQHALSDPLHPHNAKYVFQGAVVDMRGHPHPPLDAWLLSGLLAVSGHVREKVFHAAYLLLYVMAAAAVWSLARRFSPHPLIASMLFVTTPALMVQAGSLESDLPFIAFWLAGIALFIRAVDQNSRRLLAASAGLLLISSMGAFQSVLATPILGLYLWMRRRDWRAAWAVTLVTPVALLSWQLFERVTGGALPAAVLTGYFSRYALQTLANKAKNALALTGHLAWTVFPVLTVLAFWSRRRIAIALVVAAAVAGALLDPNPLYWVSFSIGVLALAACASLLKKSLDLDTKFLAGWLLIFFAAALVIFFAGAARYLLPIAAPLGFLVTRSLENRRAWLVAGLAAQTAFSYCLAIESYQQWSAYRSIAEKFQPELANHKVWVNDQWGLRYYFERLGAQPVLLDSVAGPGDIIVTSELSYPVPIAVGRGVLKQIWKGPVTSPIPLRTLALGTHSAFSTITFGLRPFDFSTQPIDWVKVETVEGRKPTLSYLPMNAPEADYQIVRGLYAPEGQTWRWSGQTAEVLLVRPAQPMPLQASIYIPGPAVARHAALLVDGRKVAEQSFPGEGQYTLQSSEPIAPGSDPVRVDLEIDKTFQPPGDSRNLGVIVSGIGFK